MATDKDVAYVPFLDRYLHDFLRSLSYDCVTGDTNSLPAHLERIASEIEQRNQPRHVSHTVSATTCAMKKQVRFVKEVMLPLFLPLQESPMANKDLERKHGPSENGEFKQISFFGTD